MGNLGSYGINTIVGAILDGLEDGVDLNSSTHQYIAPVKYVALYKTDGTEVSNDPSYRQAIAAFNNSQSNASGLLLTNAAPITFTSPGGWGTVRYVGLVSQGTTGNASDAFLYVALGQDKDMNTAGTTLTIPAGALVIRYPKLSTIAPTSHWTDIPNQAFREFHDVSAGSLLWGRFGYSGNPPVIRFKAQLLDQNGQPYNCWAAQGEFMLTFNDTNKRFELFGIEQLSFTNSSGGTKTAAYIEYRRGVQGSDATYFDLFRVPIGSGAGVTHNNGDTLVFQKADLYITLS